MPLWLGWLIAIAMLGGVVTLVTYVNRGAWGVSWRYAVGITVVMLLVELAVVGVGRR